MTLEISGKTRERFQLTPTNTIFGLYQVCIRKLINAVVCILHLLQYIEYLSHTVHRIVISLKTLF
jgi:hypothetical protein